MYYANQIIWDIDRKKLVELSNPSDVWAWDTSQFPEKHTNLIYTAKAQGGKKAGDIYVCEGGVTGAEYLMKQGEIEPNLKEKSKK